MTRPFEFNKSLFFAILLVLGLTAYDLSKNLNAPSNGESIQISMNIPDGFSAHDVKAVYKSKTCTYSGISMATGAIDSRDGYYHFTVTPTRQTNSTFHTAEVPLSGGWRCNWKLSEIRFGLGYRNPAHFGENTVTGQSTNLVISYDEHNSGYNGTTAEGDLVVKKDLYPWIHERFINGHVTSINLFGQYGIHNNYYAPQARNIHFEPVVHSAFIVYSRGHKGKKVGRKPIFIYPDGSMQTESLVEPNFEKLQSIRAEAEQLQQ